MLHSTKTLILPIFLLFGAFQALADGGSSAGNSDGENCHEVRNFQMDEATFIERDIKPRDLKVEWTFRLKQETPRYVRVNKGEARDRFNVSFDNDDSKKIMEAIRTFDEQLPDNDNLTYDPNIYFSRQSLTDESEDSPNLRKNLVGSLRISVTDRVWNVDSARPAK